MDTLQQLAILGIIVVMVFGIVAPATTGASPARLANDPVSTIGHVCDQWGLTNNWGDHVHGDDWSHHRQGAGHHGGTTSDGHHHGNGGHHGH